MCAVTRGVFPVSELLRFVADPNGVIVPDVKAKLPGRGVWVEAKASTLKEAIRKRVFGRALKRDVTVKDGLLDQTAALMRERVVQALAMANKAGQAVTGREKVAAALQKRRIAYLIHASEAGEDGVKKLNAIIADRNCEVLRFLTLHEMSLAFGRPNVVHAAVTQGPATALLQSEIARYRRFTEDTGGVANGAGHADTGYGRREEI